MTHGDYQELLAASALSALDPADTRALSHHLESCEECRLELGQWEESAALLALDAPPLEPASDVRARILASVRVEPRVEVRPTVDSQSKQNVVPFVVPARKQKNIWQSFGSFGAIAATIVFVGLMISVVVLWRQNQSLRAQRDHERAILALLTKPESQMAKLEGTKMAPGAHAMLAYDKDGHAMVMAKGLPAAPAGMAYQLWFIKDNKKMPGKVFTIDAAGNAMLEDEVPAMAREAAVFAVTLEPATGVSAPTGSIYLVSES
ncbi:MAG TPA: anti-sigma factor [Pyrinomonadaceae bacterium]|nr:anti-sigma factor [Pyrinomonadaceae bacterium]